ncbi:MAG: hypothetical protein K2X81_07420 [Candidatus Obscuribacterales bacterium]|nr:hypothetical protein [Candidatus Obscuribacterales bacterium]
MSDDSDPPKQNEFEPDGLSNRGPRNTRIGASDGENDFVRLLKRAIRKIEKETGKVPTIEQVAALLKLPVSSLQHSIDENKDLLMIEGSTVFRSFITQVLSDQGPFRPGQLIICKIIAAEPGGYAVLITTSNLRGFIPTEIRMKIGEEVLAQYVCIHNNRVLLSIRSAYRGQQDHNEAIKLRANRSYDLSPVEAEPDYQSSYPLPVETRLRRATDLIMPPLDNTQRPNRMRIGQEDDLLWLVTDLEGGERTGCVKAFCEAKKSRAAVLLYRGRAVGCVYNNKKLTDPLAIDGSLQMMLKDCQTPDTALVMYSLPEEVILAMSALFLGYPLERSDDLDARTYMDYILSWFKQKEQTACLAFSLPSSCSTVLAFVSNGQFVGAFFVDTQEFSEDVNQIYKSIADDPLTRVEASILPSELLSQDVRLGFSLSLNMPK